MLTGWITLTARGDSSGILEEFSARSSIHQHAAMQQARRRRPISGRGHSASRPNKKSGSPYRCPWTSSTRDPSLTRQPMNATRACGIVKTSKEAWLYVASNRPLVRQDHRRKLLKTQTRAVIHEWNCVSSRVFLAIPLNLTYFDIFPELFSMRPSILDPAHDFNAAITLLLGARNLARQRVGIR